MKIESFLAQNPVGPTAMLAYKPNTFNPAKKYKLVLFFHGSYEFGNGTLSALAKLQNSTNHASLVRWVDEKDFIVLAPQFNQAANYIYENERPRQTWWPDWKGGQYISDIIDWAIANLPIDPNEIGITGLSAGGGAVLDAITQKPEFSKKIKRMLALCPAPQDVVDYNAAVQAGIAVRVVHAVNDPSNKIGKSIEFVNELNTRKIQPVAEMVQLPSGGHSIWGGEYAKGANIDFLLTAGGTSIPQEPEEPEPPTKTVVAKLEITVYSDGTTETKKLQ